MRAGSRSIGARAIPRRGGQAPRAPILRGAFALAALLTLDARADASVVIVDASGKGSFTTIQPALAAALDGDVILVRGGSYPGFIVGNQTVRVIADAGAHVVVAGTVTISGLSAEKSVVLQGLNAIGPSFFPVAKPGASIVNSAGFVRLQDCSFQGGQASSGGSCAVTGTGGHGADVAGSPRVAFAACTLRGGTGAHYPFQVCSGGRGGDGARIATSSVALYESFLFGGSGGLGDDFSHADGGRGGQGARVSDAVLFAGRSSFRGGHGGGGYDGGNGGDALEVIAPGVAHLQSCTYFVGQSGWFKGGQIGTPGQTQAGNGSFDMLPGIARVLAAPALASNGGSLEVTVYGQPGDRVWILGSTPAHHFSPTLCGMRLVRVPALSSVAPAVVLPASGDAVVAVPIVLPPGAPATTLFLQGFVIDAQGVPTLASPLHPTVLDCADAIADCDGDGVFDTCSVLSGASTDCDANGVLDECEVDCNANGVTDACDVADRSSSDANGNGIPDECEPFAQTRHVDAAAAPGGDGSAAFPFRTIGEAIAPSLSGDTVLVADGVYTGPENRDLGFGGRDLVVKSVNGPGSCVIDCQELGTGFFIENGESAAASIEGFTIRKGKTFSYGGGIRVYDSEVTIRRCVFEDCSADSGGGLDLTDSDSEVSECIFVGNLAQYGGGLSLHGQSPRVRDCHLAGNSATLRGGGLYIDPWHSDPLLVRGCRILDNESGDRGGGIYVDSGAPLDTGPVQISECLVAGNHSDYGSAVYYRYINVEIQGSTLVDNPVDLAAVVLGALDGRLWLANSIVWGAPQVSGPVIFLQHSTTALTVEFCDIQGAPASVQAISGATLTWGQGNFALDPSFLDADGADGNALTFDDNDYRLGVGSPCVDAGDNASVAQDAFDLDLDSDVVEPTPFDLGGNPRFQDDPATADTGSGTPPIVDIGAHEKGP